MAAASSIFVNTWYQGQIASNDDKDFYQFTITSSGRINLIAEADMQYIYYRIYDTSGTELWSKNYLEWNGTTKLISTNENIDLTAGTYYFVAEKKWGYTGNYKFSLGYGSAGESFAESGNGSNNSIYTANAVALNMLYSGQLAANDEKDFYRFSVSTSGIVTLKASAGMERICYRIYNASGKEIHSWQPYWNETTHMIETDWEVKLTAGTYYLVFEKYWSRTGTYSFQLIPHIHNFQNEITAATMYDDGKIVQKCSCGESAATAKIYHPEKIILSKTKYTYDGKKKRPSVTVKDSAGRVISPVYYSVSYERGCKNVGEYSVTVNFRGNYSGSGSRSFEIYPKGSSISKVTAKSRGFKVKVKKQKSQISGYQIMYATNKKFSGARTQYIYNGHTSANVNWLKARKRYYVRVRTYKIVGGTWYYSSWSSAKTVRTKK